MRHNFVLVLNNWPLHPLPNWNRYVLLTTNSLLIYLFSVLWWWACRASKDFVILQGSFGVNNSQMSGVIMLVIDLGSSVKLLWCAYHQAIPFSESGWVRYFGYLLATFNIGLQNKTFCKTLFVYSHHRCVSNIHTHYMVELVCRRVIEQDHYRWN